MGVEGRSEKFWVSTLQMTEVCKVSADGLHHVQGDDMTEQIDESQQGGAPAPVPGTIRHDAQQAQQGGAVGPWGGGPSQPQPQQPQPQPQLIDQTSLESALQNVLGGMMGAGPQSFADALNDVDPRDSEAALAMLDWLLRNKRLNRVGTLDGGQGYLFVYQEPKGTSKEGYVPGGTQGGRVVDDALDKQREAGVTPKGPSSLCKKCYSAVRTLDDGSVVLDDASEDAKCSADGGAHDPA